MDNLIFSLNATVPIFLLMVLGLFFRKLNWIDEEFATKMNAFVFRVPLPVMLFADLAKVDFKSAWNGKFVLFCFITTLLSIILVALFPFSGKIKPFRESLFRRLTEAVPPSSVLHLSKIYTAIPVWLRL